MSVKRRKIARRIGGRMQCKLYWKRPADCLGRVWGRLRALTFARRSRGGRKKRVIERRRRSNAIEIVPGWRHGTAAEMLSKTSGCRAGTARDRGPAVSHGRDAYGSLAPRKPAWGRRPKSLARGHWRRECRVEQSSAGFANERAVYPGDVGRVRRPCTRNDCTTARHRQRADGTKRDGRARRPPLPQVRCVRARKVRGGTLDPATCPVGRRSFSGGFHRIPLNGRTGPYGTRACQRAARKRVYTIRLCPAPHTTASCLVPTLRHATFRTTGGRKYHRAGTRFSEKHTRVRCYSGAFFFSFGL